MTKSRSSIRWMLIQIGDWPFQSFDKGCHCLEWPPLGKLSLQRWKTRSDARILYTYLSTSLKTYYNMECDVETVKLSGMLASCMDFLIISNGKLENSYLSNGDFLLLIHWVTWCLASFRWWTLGLCSTAWTGEDLELLKDLHMERWEFFGEDLGQESWRTCSFWWVLPLGSFGLRLSLGFKNESKQTMAILSGRTFEKNWNCRCNAL